MKNEKGYTLIELLVVMGLAAILFTLSVGAARNFWLVRSLHGSGDEVVRQLRQTQERTVSESHPLIYGARFRAGSSQWAVVRFDPGATTATSDDTCSEVGTREFASGVQVATVDVADVDVTTFCRQNLPGAMAQDEFFFFYARGNATAGTLALSHTSLPGRAVTVTVTPVTGRVSRS